MRHFQKGFAWRAANSTEAGEREELESLRRYLRAQSLQREGGGGGGGAPS